MLIAFVLLWARAISLNLPKNNVSRIALIIEAAGVIVYIVHLFPKSPSYLDVAGFLLFVAAFVLLCLGIIHKRL
jgi:hypothetical protein